MQISKNTKKKILATSKFNKISLCDIIIITVPTPLKKNFIPDLSFIKNSVKSILPFLKKNQLISLESTSYPGTTEDEITKKLKINTSAKTYLFVILQKEKTQVIDILKRKIFQK